MNKKLLLLNLSLAASTGSASDLKQAISDANAWIDSIESRLAKLEISEEETREAFENDLMFQSWPRESFRRNDNGDYAQWAIQIRWLGFRAGAITMQERCK